MKEMSLTEMLAGNENVTRMYRKGEAVPPEWYGFKGDEGHYVTFGTNVNVYMYSGVFHVYTWEIDGCFVEIKAIDGECDSLFYPRTDVFWSGPTGVMRWVAGPHNGRDNEGSVGFFENTKGAVRISHASDILH